jgi:hypothetical protein
VNFDFFLRYNNLVEVMSNKTITKKIIFVISWLTLIANFTGCFTAVSKDEKQTSGNKSEAANNYLKPQIVGKIESNEITESSGLVASRCNKDVLWTHNDSGDAAFIYAINVKGEKLGTWKVSGAKNNDWEDIATFKNEKGECFLYIGDIGNNERLKTQFTIYRVKEPRVSGADKTSSRKNPSETETAEAIKYDYPDMRHDAETLLVHPQTGDVYVLSKSLSSASSVYKLPKNYDLNKTNRLEKVADFTVPAFPNGLLTGGEVSQDGKRVIVCDYFAAYEIILPEKAKSFDEIWREKPLIVELGERTQGEAVCYSTDGKSIFATSEKKNSPIIQAKRN